MSINDLVPDLSICQEAKEKGVVIESEYRWNVEDNEIIGKDIWYFGKNIPAPLTDEILLKLPANFVKDNKFYSLKTEKVDDGYLAFYDTGKDEEYEILFINENKKLSNALLLLYMKLVDEKIIEV